MVYNPAMVRKNKEKTAVETRKVKKEPKKIDFGFIGGVDEENDLIGALKSVDLNSPDAELNETSISDNNGGRIILNEDDKSVVKK